MSDHERVTPIMGTELARQIERVRRSGELGYRSAQPATWCPGCGYHGVALALTRAAAAAQVPPHQLVLVAGAGCAAWMPRSLRGYGIEALAGTALAVAAGAKLARPELTVVVVGGDADILASGAGGLSTAAARNLPVTLLIVDNGRCGLIHGLPSPAGAADPLVAALETGATLAGRGWAGKPDALGEVIARALRHPGFAVVVAVSPCITYDMERITWDRLYDAWQPVPAGHDPSDRAAALALARREPFVHGILYERQSGDSLKV